MTTKNAAIDQIINRARSMKPAARAKFIGSYNASEIADIYTALLGAPKPRTPRPALERKILAALDQLAPDASSSSTPTEVAGEETSDVAANTSDASTPTDAPAADTASDGPVDAGAPTIETGAPARDDRMPPVGTVVKKLDRHGKVRCECKVVEGGIEYAGKVYKSLSAAALASARDLGLETKTVDGWAWWGLKAKGDKGAKRDPLAALRAGWAKYLERVAGAEKNITDDGGRAKLAELLREQRLGLDAAATRLAPAAAPTGE